MKKLIALLMAVVMAFAMVACQAPAAEPVVEEPVVEEPVVEEVVEEPAEEEVAEEPVVEEEVVEEEPELLTVNVGELFANVGMVAAEEYAFVCSDGYEHKVIAEDIAGCTLFAVDGRIDGLSPDLEGTGYTIMDVVEIIPVELTAETIDAAAGVQRIIVFESTANKAGLEVTEQPRGDETATNCYSFAAFAEAALWCEPLEEISVVATDGYAADYLFADVNEKYVTFGHAAAPTFAGEKADPNIEPWFMAYIVLGAEAVAFAAY